MENLPNVKKSEAPVKGAEGKSEIEVVATRAGFYAQRRLSEGARFMVKDFSELGEWMKCVDSKMERKRVQFFKDKKKAK